MNIELYKGDCLKELKKIKNESVDIVLTDIPYGIDYMDWDVRHKNKNSALMGQSPAQQGKSIFKYRGKPKNGWSEEDRKRPSEFQEFCEIFLQELWRVMKPASTMISFVGRQNQHRFVVASENVGFIYKDMLVWDKGKSPFRAQSIDKVFKRRGIYSDTNFRLGNLAPRIEPIIWSFKPYNIGGTLTDCFIKYGTGCFSDEIYKSNLIKYDSEIKNRMHETQKPVGLISNLIKTFSQKNQTVLDPFMGSGTTGVACVNTERKFIGIELDDKYFKIAEERINKAKDLPIQGELF